MILGILAVWLGLAATLTATLCYFVAMRGELVAARAEAGEGEKTEGRRQKAVGKTQKAVKANGSAAPLPSAFCLLPSARWGRLARRAFYLSAACAFVTAAVFMTLILGRHYELAYIWEHSGNDLPLKYRFASFWSGQEGTFLLWTIYGSILGLLLIHRSRRWESFVMPFFCIMQLFLFVLLTVMSPFKLVEQPPLAAAGFAATWQTMLQYFGLAHLFRPPDGQGLTPLLQNYWMVIHPPVVFTGFATLAVPACFALGALVKRDYDNWIEMAVPWATFGWMILGIGVFLGGYWAYETLGWGGYWAWDPVENASVVPWLFATALVHGMLAQRARNSLKQANLFLAMTAFFAVLYGTFLTRSGVLGDFSVHSFVSPGRLIYLLMVAIMAVFVFGGVGLWLRRLPDIKGESAYDSLTERHFGLFLAAVLLIGSGVIIGLGMSFPLIAPLFIHKKGSLSPAAYNRAMVPIGTFVALLMAATPLMPWRHAGGTPRPWKWSQKLVYGICFAILAAGAVAAYIAWTGVRPQAAQLISTTPAGDMTPQPLGPFPPDFPALGVFAAAIVLALCVNIGMFFKTVRFGILTTGAWVAHTGLTLVLLAVLVTSIYSRSAPLMLRRGETGQAFGYTFQYLGLTTGSGREGDRDHLKFVVSRGSDRMLVRLPYYSATMPSGEKQLIRNPAIRKYWDHDLYMSANQQSDGTDGVELKWGEIGRAGGYQIRFKRFAVTGIHGHGHGGSSAGAITVRSILEVTRDGKTTTLEPAYSITRDNQVTQPAVTMPGGDYMLSVFKIVPGEGGPETGSVQLMLTPTSPGDMASIDVSYKPYINVLWFGGFLMALGAFLAWRRRVLLARKAAVREEAREREVVPLPTPRNDRVPTRRPVPVPATGKR